MISLRQLLETVAPNTKISVYITEQKGSMDLGTASQFLHHLQEDEGDGLVQYFTASANRLHLYLEKIEGEQN
jgi:hypothetical protein